MRVSSSTGAGLATEMKPLGLNIQATQLVSPRLPPFSRKIWRTSFKVRLWLSVVTSTIMATPLGPYPS